MASTRELQKPRMAECHPERRHRAKGLCASCYVKKWAKEHPDANTGNNWSRTHPEQHRVAKIRAALKQRHGITYEQFVDMWNRQGGTCANPGCSYTFALDRADYRRALHVDHDHSTGRIRALLCAKCNVALGQVGDDRARLAGLIEYLELHQQNTSPDGLN